MQLKVKRNTEKFRLLLYVLGLRSSLFLIELGVGIWSNSLSLIAGSGHLLSDLVSLGLTILVTWLVQHRSTDEVNFGYQRVENWVALLNGLSLLAIALLITWEAVGHLQSRQLVLGLPMLIVAGLSMIINGISIHLLHSEIHHDLNVRGVFLHGVADTASSFGVMLSAVAVYFWNWFWADAVASLLIAILLSMSAIFLIRDSLQTLKDQSI